MMIIIIIRRRRRRRRRRIRIYYCFKTISSSSSSSNNNNNIKIINTYIYIYLFFKPHKKTCLKGALITKQKQSKERNCKQQRNRTMHEYFNGSSLLLVSLVELKVVPSTRGQTRNESGMSFARSARRPFQCFFGPESPDRITELVDSEVSSHG